MAVKYIKEYDGVDEDFRSTKLFVLVCTKHEVVLKENEGYSFARQVGETGVIWEFDEDEVDLSGFSCPENENELDENFDRDCSDNWTAAEITRA